MVTLICADCKEIIAELSGSYGTYCKAYCKQCYVDKMALIEQMELQLELIQQRVLDEHEVKVRVIT